MTMIKQAQADSGPTRTACHDLSHNTVLWYILPHWAQVIGTLASERNQ